MTDDSISLQQITIADAGRLLTVSRKTFFDSCGPLNTPADMESYALVAFTP